MRYSDSCTITRLARSHRRDIHVQLTSTRTRLRKPDEVDEVEAEPAERPAEVDPTGDLRNGAASAGGENPW